MTAPPQSLADAVPEPTTAEEPVRDELVEELRGWLHPIAEAVLTVFAQGPDSSLARRVRDDERVRLKVIERVTDDADTLLGKTNEQITELRRAREARDAHQAPPGTSAGQPDRRDKTAHAALGTALWLGVLVPVVVWQLLQTPLSPAAHFWVSAAVVVAGFAMLRPVQVGVARAGRRLNGQPALGGAGWPFLTGVATTYLVLILRLWTSSREGMGQFWAVVVWVVAGLVTAVLLFMVAAVTNTRFKDEPPGRRLPAPVVLRELGVTLLALLILSPVFTGPGEKWTTWLLLDMLCSLIAVFGGPLLLSVPARFSRDPARFGSPAWTRRQETLEQAAETGLKEWTKAAAALVEQRVRLHLTAVLDPPFGTVLPELDRGALGQMRPGEQVFLDTEAARRLRALLSGIRGGAVGMAGPRGVGKSTLLEAYQAGLFLEPNRVHIALVESVPVRYDAREFVLHLYARMCEAVIEFCESELAEAAEQPGRWAVVWPRLRRAWPFAAVVVACVLVGVLGSLTLRSPQADLRTWLTANWWALVTVLGVAGTAALARRRRRVSPPEPADVPEPARLEPGDWRALKALAAEQLGKIRYQQKHTSGWSGKVGLPAGAEAGVSGSRETTRQPLTYPQIVHEFSAFLGLTVGCVRGLAQMATPSVVVILDELDKIVSAEAAQDFVNEIKALLNLDVPGFLLLVSVSEDALASFERRGLPVRDAFDSTFDSIFRIEHLRLGDAQQLLNLRVLELPEPFVCLAHCLSGGLPRELIRVTRQVLGSAGQLADVAHRLVEEELRDKRAALRTVVGRDTYDDIAVSDLVRHVDAHAIADGAALLAAVAQPPVTAVTTEAAALHRLQLETLGHLYYLGTVLEVFGPAFSPADLERGHTEGDTSFDTLTSVRQLFPVNARLAWLTISAFRRAWALPVVDPPDPRAAPRDNGA